MKKTYTGLKAEKVELGFFSMVTGPSLPSGCMQIVANVVEPGGNTCHNPGETISYMYFGDHPSFPDD